MKPRINFVDDVGLWLTAFCLLRPLRVCGITFRGLVGVVLIKIIFGVIRAGYVMPELDPILSALGRRAGRAATIIALRAPRFARIVFASAHDRRQIGGER